MKIIPGALEDVIEALAILPGVGPRSAERFAAYLLKSGPTKTAQIAHALSQLHDAIGYCQKTYALIDKNKTYSDLYLNPSRDRTLVAVVADAFDIVAIEKTGSFRGTYHVLGGLVSPLEGINPENLHIEDLVKRVEEDGVTEIILATNASVEGESTALYIQNQMGGRDVRISRLAQGLPIGADIEYTDQLTLARAMEHRQAL